MFGGFVGIWYYVTVSGTLASKAFEKIQLNKQTSTGNLEKIAISPDGKFIAFSEKRETGTALSVKQVSGGNTMVLVQPGEQQFIGLTFSTDSGSIFYVSRTEPSDPRVPFINILYKISVLGGVPQQVAANVDSGVGFSPDGKRMAFIRNNHQAQESALLVTDSAGADERQVSVRAIRERFMPDGAAWSPDGKFIAVPVRCESEAKIQMQVLVVNVQTGEQNPVTSHEWDWVGQVSWLRDGSGILFPVGERMKDR